MKAFPRDIDVFTMTIRHIGIESELQVGQDGYSPSRELMQSVSKRGLLMGDPGWDGGGREFRTNPISTKSLKQVRGYKYLREYFDSLKAETRVTERGGTHIHISILNSDHENMESNATAMGVAFFKQFQKISGRRTHWAGQYPCNNITEVRDHLRGRRQGASCGRTRAYCRYGSMLNPTYYQTLEFRGPKGSNDADEILAWIQFLENVVKKSNRKCINGVKFADLLKGEHISKYIESLDGWRKLTKSDLNATVNVNALA